MQQRVKPLSSSSPSSSFDRSKKLVSRKRNLASVGVGILAVAAAAPLISSSSQLVQATPLYQHRVGRPHRHVQYRHILEQTQRGPSSGFWYPDETEEEAPPASSLFTDDDDDGETQAEAVDHESGMVWTLVADAARQHPDGAPRVSRREAEPPQQQQQHQQQQDENTEDSVRRRRRDKVVDKFVADSTAAVLQEQGVAPGSGDGEQQAAAAAPAAGQLEQSEAVDASPAASSGSIPITDTETNEVESDKSNYIGFNVTAEILLDHSESADKQFPGGDHSSSVVTTSVTNNGSSSVYQPLRIRAIVPQERDGGEYLSSQARFVLLDRILQPALLTWSAALRVEPVVGNLTVDERQLFDNQTCGPGLDSGLPSPKVPSYHLKEGVPDTDMILYVSVSFTKEYAEQAKDKTRTRAPEEDPTTVATDMRGSQRRRRRWLEWFQPNEDPSWSSSSKKTQSPSSSFFSGTSGTTEEEEEVIYYEPIPDIPDSYLCSGDYVAAASYCSTDQYDRPTAGMLHICINEDTLETSSRNKTIVTVMHEVGHALGFNSRSMAHFRRPDGSPITPRVDGEIVETEVECTGPSNGRQNALVTLPSEEILQFRTVRGGVRVAEVVTPSVVQVVRNHFDCQNLTGAELESGEFSPLAADPLEQACIGDHWERRLFKNDLMNPVVDSVEYSPFISTITLAYFADSGWYQVDLSMAELAASWGRGAGCSFVEDTCIGEDGQVPPSNKPFFCNAAPKTTTRGLVKQEIDGCTPDLSRKATCSLGQYDTELPFEYQYFGLTYGGTVGGDDPFIDYCPTYTGFNNGLCSNSENAALLQVNRVERFGKRNSRCLSGSVNKQNTALCMPIACVVEDRSLHVKISGKWKVCTAKDEQLRVRDGEFVSCPDPRRVCPTFYCHHDCLGTSGRCDYDTGTCVCSWANSETSDDTVADVFTGAELGNRTTGVCKQKNAVTKPAMPHATSLLSEYYVPYKKELRNDYYLILTDLQITVVTVLVIIFGAALFWHFQMKGRGIPICGVGGEGGNNDSPPEAPTSVNPNKHKMIASVLVDMRMGHNGEVSVAQTNDTAASLYGLDSSASVGSSLCASSLDTDDRFSLASEDIPSEEVVDVLADPRQPKKKSNFAMRKRRFKGHFSNKG